MVQRKVAVTVLKGFNIDIESTNHSMEAYQVIKKRELFYSIAPFKLRILHRTLAGITTMLSFYHLSLGNETQSHTEQRFLHQIIPCVSPRTRMLYCSPVNSHQASIYH
uniref:Uncharacterized protein n=1 Tax=Sphaerodactylus townsendi TaxID=933632 RepID=A0ACB8EL79_9SAUR